MVAPEDGYIMNLQVQPGMVAGDVRFGAIASFICDDNRYLLANFFQENLKYVKPGQLVEVALDLYPGQIWRGKVQAIWQGSGAGQMLPSGTLPNFNYVPSEVPQGQFAVAITLDDPDQLKFPIGTQGRAAIYTNPGQRLRRPAQGRDPRLHLVQLAVSVLRMMRAALLVAAALLAGCALKTPPTHTDVVEQALPTDTRIPPAWRADPRGGEVDQRLAEVVQRPDARSASSPRRSPTTRTCARRRPRSPSRSRR